MISIRSKNKKYLVNIDLRGGFIDQIIYDGFACFYKSKWCDSQDVNSLDRLTQHLGGEFTCIPFGTSNNDSVNFKKALPHGYSCHSRWKVVHRTKYSILLKLQYPNDYDIDCVYKCINLKKDKVEVNIKLHVKNNCSLTLGEHPCFDMKDGVVIKIKGQGITYPYDLEKTSFTKHSYIFDSLSKVLSKDNEYIDFSQLPLNNKSESILQMLDPKGEINLIYPSFAKKICFKWDCNILPYCLLWVSNGGRDYFPWNSDNYCLGVEPINCAYDLGPISLYENHLNKLGYPTCIHLQAKQRLNYSLSYSVCDI